MKLLAVFTLSALICLIKGHGYLESPPARNSMWRYGFGNPTNYNDNQLFCGGKIIFFYLYILIDERDGPLCYISVAGWFSHFL